MRTIYVLVKCKLGAAYDVAAQMADDIEEAASVHSISGDYDLIARFTLPESDDIGRFVNTKVHAIPGIQDTKTMIAFNAFTKDKGIGGDA